MPCEGEIADSHSDAVADALYLDDDVSLTIDVRVLCASGAVRRGAISQLDVIGHSPHSRQMIHQQIGLDFDSTRCYEVGPEAGLIVIEVRGCPRARSAHGCGAGATRPPLR